MERQKLRSARLERHWTLAQAAERVEVDVNTLSRWERGKTRPHGYNIVRLCEVYEKAPAELDLENTQEMVEAVEQLIVLSSSGSSPRASVPGPALGQAEQAQVPGEVPLLAPSLPPASFPLIAPVLLSKRPTTRVWKRRRGVLLLALLAFLVSGSIWYAGAHSLASGSGQRPSFSPAVGQVTPTATTQGRVSNTPTGRTPTSSGSTPAQKTPVSSSSTPAQKTPVSSSSTPTEGLQPTPTPVRDCLHGSASHLTFTSLLGLGNTSPRTVTFTNCGGLAENWFASVVTSGGGDWLSANPAEGTMAAGGSENVQIQAAGAGLQIGTYQGSVTFLKGSAQWTITVTFTIIQV